MSRDRHTLWTAVWPALSTGAAGVALSASVSPGLLTPSCVEVAGSFLTAAWVHRGQQEAKARNHCQRSSTAFIESPNISMPPKGPGLIWGLCSRSPKTCTMATSTSNRRSVSAPSSRCGFHWDIKTQNDPKSPHPNWNLLSPTLDNAILERGKPHEPPRPCLR